jgi:hypothetical protein
MTNLRSLKVEIRLKESFVKEKNHNKNKAEKFQIILFINNFFIYQKFSIGDVGAKELAQGLKALINLNSLELNLE